jgi:uncharacterized protein with NRDE domain
MCIAYITTENEKYPLIIALNRDEYLDRDFLPAKINDGLYYPIDIQSQGTWFGFNLKGQFGILTNIRQKHELKQLPSRGSIIPNYLKYSKRPARSVSYYNFTHGDQNNITVYSKSNQRVQQFTPKPSFSISNSFSNTSYWPKQRRLDQLLAPLKNAQSIDTEFIFQQLSNTQTDSFSAAKETGYPDELEKRFDSIFIDLPDLNYGTVYQSILIIDENGSLHFYQRFRQNNLWRDEHLLNIS